MEIINFEMIGDNVVQYYVNEGWEIIANAPNPHPCPYVYFVVRKVFNHKLNKEERREIYNKALKYSDE